MKEPIWFVEVGNPLYSLLDALWVRFPVFRKVYHVEWNGDEKSVDWDDYA